MTPATNDSENEMSADEETSETAALELIKTSESPDRTTNKITKCATAEDEAADDSDGGSEHKMIEDRESYEAPAPALMNSCETSHFAAKQITLDASQYAPTEDDSSDGSEDQMLEDQELTEAALMVMETLATSVLAEQIQLDGMDMEPIPYEEV